MIALRRFYRLLFYCPPRKRLLTSAYASEAYLQYTEYEFRLHLALENYAWANGRTLRRHWLSIFDSHLQPPTYKAKPMATAKLLLQPLVSPK